jgi:transcriptional regulator of acetoin/glycerol metabolism
MEQGTGPSAAYTNSPESLEKIELHAIQETIRHNHGNISAAARQLGVSRTTLYRKLRQNGFPTVATPPIDDVAVNERMF